MNQNTTEQPQWYAIYTKPKAEKKVNEQLQQYGYESYLPLNKELRQRSDRFVNIEAPLFRSYVFVRVNEKQYYEIPKLILGFVKYVTIGGEKIKIREQEIENIKKFLIQGSGTVEVSNEDFSINEIVEFKSGALKGIKGNLAEFRGKYKFAVRIESMGVNLLVEASRNSFKKIKSE